MSTLRRTAALSALVAFGSLLGLAAMEGALRVYDATKTKPPSPRAEFWQPRRGYGWLHHPGIEGPWFDDRGEFSVVVKMNSHGLRDVEHDYAKPHGVFRILLLGDSYVEAVQVRLEEIFPRVLEKTLNGGGRRVEVVNAAVADWGTDNQLVYFREEGFRYDPDLVLLAFTTANDVRNNAVGLNLRVPSPNPYKPTFTMAPGGTLEFHPMPELPPSPSRPWWLGTRVGEFVANRLGIVATAAPPPPSVPPERTALISKVPTDLLVHAVPVHPEVAEGWRVTKALILELQAEAKQRGAGFAMFSIDGPWVHYDEYWRMMTMKDPVARSTWDLRAPGNVLAGFCREKAIACLDTYPEFEARKAAEPLYFRVDPHWTPAGHRVAAHAVARFLVERGLVPQPAPAADGAKAG